MFSFLSNPQLPPYTLRHSTRARDADHGGAGWGGRGDGAARDERPKGGGVRAGEG